MGNDGLMNLAGIGENTQKNEKDFNECEFEIEPENWKEKYGIQPSGGGSYECDQKKIDGSNLCKYHASENELEDANLNEDDVFYSLICESNKEDRIVGAQFSEVSIYEKDIDPSGSHRISLASIRIDSLTISNCTVHTPLFFISPIIGDLKITRTNFKRKLQFKKGLFTERIRVFRAETEDVVEFLKGRYNCPLKFYRTQFNDDLLISESEINSDILYCDCDINAKLSLERPKTGQVVFIQDSYINDFDCHIQGDCSALVCLPRTRVERGELKQPEEVVPYDFGKNNSNDEKKESEEEESEEEKKGGCLEWLGLSCPVRGQEAWSQISRHLTTAQGVLFNTADESKEEKEDGGDLYDSKMRLPRELEWFLDEFHPKKEVLYDFRETKLEDVRLRPNMNKLDNYYFYNTKLDGFDFVKHRGHIQDSNWDLHKLNHKFTEYNNYSLSGSEPVPDLQTSVDEFPHPPRIRDHQETYIPATQSASEQGDNTAASNFFVRESKARKMMERRQILFPNPRRSASRVDYVLKYTRSRLWQSLCDFGENPGKIVIWSLLIIFGCASLYPAFGVTNQGEGAVLWFIEESIQSTVLESIYLSAAVFVSLGYGNITIDGTLPRLLAAGEALAGAFLIALYIFTLGRSIRR